MEENQVPNGQRKLRKIKRPRVTENQPVAYNVPDKVSLPQINDESQEIFYNNGSAENIRFISDDDMMVAQTENISDLIKNKTVLLLLTLAVIFGTFLGTILFSSNETAKRGLDGVVPNSDVPMGRSRCGLVEPHQGCVLYIMNPSNKERNARELFSDAARWTGRQKYLIETGNMHYGSKLIKPGHIAQINIPPLSGQ